MHAGYIIGRGMRVVEWNVAEHPDKPDGDLASMKLRALTPDGIRIAIAKEYGLSNYREVILPLTHSRRSLVSKGPWQQREPACKQALRLHLQLC